MGADGTMGNSKLDRCESLWPAIYGFGLYHYAPLTATLATVEFPLFFPPVGRAGRNRTACAFVSGG